MRPAKDKMPPWAARLIAAERTGEAGDSDARAGFRVCEKMRGPLSTLAGAAGFRSLLSRAWVLGKAEATWLADVQITSDGSFGFPAARKAELDSAEAAHAAGVLLNQLLHLLVTFIGEALTRRLVQEVWPAARLEAAKSGENTYENKS